MQPNYINWLAGGPRHFSGDFFITGWLDSIGVEFDVATDEDVDSLGKGLLDSYDVVLTGSHPEYPTSAEFDAFEDYVKGGGRLMYLGANGFFWVTSYVNKLRIAIEVRRGYAAQRNWTSHAGELYHSSTGEMGGAYRHRGRDQNPFLGVGMAAAGWGPASGFTRTPESYGETVAWVFEGIASETVGEHGYLLGGAAGDELDHADPARGTPDSTVVLMSSRHNDLFFPSLDSVTEVAPNQQGSKNPHVRADVVLVEHPGGGKVFSTGSICWAGSLGTNNYDNDIARLTTNVLRKFLAE
jgi:N,N-dimethylformamidase